MISRLIPAGLNMKSWRALSMTSEQILIDLAMAVHGNKTGL